ncbi:MAG: LamG-like jellyroll fold domain-containing protein [Candidatus Pacearchaeota archaeon]|jgi:hypothetical protein
MTSKRVWIFVILLGIILANILNISAVSPIIHYKFDDSIIDFYNPTNPATVVGTTTFIEGKNGKALSFDGLSRLETKDLLTGKGNQMTYSLWVKRYSSLNTYNMFMGQHLPYFGFMSDGRIIFSMNIAGTQKSVYSIKKLLDNTWYNLVFTYDGTSMKIYIDGVLDNTLNAPGTVTYYSTYKFSFGDGRSSLWYPFKGAIDEVRVYNSAISASDITSDYNYIFTLPILTPPSYPTNPTTPITNPILPPINPCTPTTCPILGKSCGSWSDGCGSYLTCGICPIGQTCSNGNCITTCTPSCTNKQCGPDGCSGFCGTCTSPLVCNSNYQCSNPSCIPSCSGKYCGDNGCGGTCGTCPTNYECKSGLCYQSCLPNCAGKNCGSDGCSGSCGTCMIGNFCNNGVCGPSCLPNCFGKTCGDNECGGTCGTCQVGQTCTNGQCVGSCIPNCAGKTCGDNGCGGTCGTCQVGQTCTNGQCVGSCIPNCAGKTCGSDGCSGTCGTCQVGQTCTNGVCDGTCVPHCSNNIYSCSEDGCGGRCGTWTLVSSIKDECQCEYEIDNLGTLSSLKPVEENEEIKPEVIITQKEPNEKSFGERLVGFNKFIKGLFLGKEKPTITADAITGFAIVDDPGNCSFDCKKGLPWNGTQCSTCSESNCLQYDSSKKNCTSTCTGCQTCNGGACKSKCNYTACQTCSNGNCSSTMPAINGSCSFCFNGQSLSESPNPNLCESCYYNQTSLTSSIIDQCKQKNNCQQCSNGACIHQCWGMAYCSNISTCNTPNPICPVPKKCTQTETKTYRCDISYPPIYNYERTEIPCTASNTCKIFNTSGWYKVTVHSRTDQYTTSYVCSQSGNKCSPPANPPKKCYKQDSLGVISNRDIIVEYSFLPDLVLRDSYSGIFDWAYLRADRISKVCSECETCDINNPNAGCIADSTKNGKSCTFYEKDPYNGKGVIKSGKCSSGICTKVIGKTCSQNNQACSSCEYCKYYNSEKIIKKGNDFVYLNIKPGKLITEPIVISNPFDVPIKYEVILKSVYYDTSQILIGVEASNFINEPIKGTILAKQNKIINFNYATNFLDYSFVFEIKKSIPQKGINKLDLSVPGGMNCIKILYDSKAESVCLTRQKTINHIIKIMQNIYPLPFRSFNIFDFATSSYNGYIQKYCKTRFETRYGLSNYPVALNRDNRKVCSGTVGFESCVNNYINNNPLECSISSDISDTYNFVFKAEPKESFNGTCLKVPIFNNCSISGKIGCCNGSESTRSSCKIINDSCTSNSQCGCNQYCNKGESYVRNMWKNGSNGTSVQWIYARNFEVGKLFNGSIELFNYLDINLTYHIHPPTGSFIIGDYNVTLKPNETRYMNFTSVMPSIETTSTFNVNYIYSVPQSCGNIIFTTDNPSDCTLCNRIIPLLNNLSLYSSSISVIIKYTTNETNSSYQPRLDFYNDCNSLTYTAINGTQTSAGAEIFTLINDYLKTNQLCTTFTSKSTEIKLLKSPRINSCQTGTCNITPELTWTNIEFLVSPTTSEKDVFFLPYNEYNIFVLRGATKSAGSCSLLLTNSDNTITTKSLSNNPNGYFREIFNGYFSKKMLTLKCPTCNSEKALCITDLKLNPSLEFSCGTGYLYDVGFTGKVITDPEVCPINYYSVYKEFDDKPRSFNYGPDGATYQEIADYYFSRLPIIKVNAQNMQGRFVDYNIHPKDAWAKLMKAIDLSSKTALRTDITKEQKFEYIRNYNLISDAEMKALEKLKIVRKVQISYPIVNDYGVADPKTIFSMCFSFFKDLQVAAGKRTTPEDVYIHENLKVKTSFKAKKDKVYEGGHGAYHLVIVGWYVHDSQIVSVSDETVGSDYIEMANGYNGNAALMQTMLELPFYFTGGVNAIRYKLNPEEYDSMTDAVLTDVGEGLFNIATGAVLSKALPFTLRIIKRVGTNILTRVGVLESKVADEVILVLKTTPAPDGTSRWRIFRGKSTATAAEIESSAVDVAEEIIDLVERTHAEKMYRSLSKLTKAEADIFYKQYDAMKVIRNMEDPFAATNQLKNLLETPTGTGFFNNPSLQVRKSGTIIIEEADIVKINSGLKRKYPTRAENILRNHADFSNLKFEPAANGGTITFPDIKVRVKNPDGTTALRNLIDDTGVERELEKVYFKELKTLTDRARRMQFGSKKLTDVSALTEDFKDYVLNNYQGEELSKILSDIDSADIVDIFNPEEMTNAFIREHPDARRALMKYYNSEPAARFSQSAIHPISQSRVVASADLVENAEVVFIDYANAANEKLRPYAVYTKQKILNKVGRAETYNIQIDGKVAGSMSTFDSPTGDFFGNLREIGRWGTSKDASLIIRRNEMYGMFDEILSESVLNPVSGKEYSKMISVTLPEHQRAYIGMLDPALVKKYTNIDNAGAFDVTDRVIAELAKPISERNPAFYTIQNTPSGPIYHELYRLESDGTVSLVIRNPETFVEDTFTPAAFTEYRNPDAMRQFIKTRIFTE